MKNHPPSRFAKWTPARRRTIHARVLPALVMGVCLCMVPAMGLIPSTAIAQSNPIVLENQLPGTTDWEIPWGSAGGDVNGEIKGYASAPSVNKGESINFHVSVNPAQTYTIDVYRIGWYQGLGGRLVQHIGPLNGNRQAAPTTDPITGLIECQWTPSYTLTAQPSWTSGAYVALLKNAHGFQNYIIFVVRDDSRVGGLIYKQPVTTYQAYNDFPWDDRTGKSLYAFNSFGATTVGGTKGAVKVSFDRPYSGDGDNYAWGRNLLAEETAFIRWMERSGYDVTYSTDLDAHTDGGRLLNYRGFISGGHDEYWSKEMYDSLLAARDAGVNIAFFTADSVYTQVRFEPSSSGAPNRVMVCYREAALDPITDPARKTVNWRDEPVNRPEQALIGVQYVSLVQADSQGIYAPYVVTNSGHWVYGGTGFSDGDTVLGLVGYEADRLFDEFAQPNAVPGTYTLLSHSPFAGSNNPEYANSSLYQAPSGAWVFGAGTINWGFALDAYNPGAASIEDPRIQRMTANILDRFLGTSDNNFLLATVPSARTMTPGSSTTFEVRISPTGGFTNHVTLSVSGLPAGTSASFNTNPATATSTLLVTTTAGTPTGTFPLTITGVSGSLTHTTTATLTVLLPDFALNPSPATRTILVGGSTTYSVAISRVGGFANTINLSVSGLPAGSSGTFTPNPATASSTLSITTSAGTPPGTYPLTITGVGGSLTRTANATLTVWTGIAITSPNTAVSWQVTTKKNITFTHNLGVGKLVNLSVSRDGGATWSSITNYTTTSATSGTYAWTINGPPTTQARIRATSTTNASVTDTSDVNFTIINPVITVTSPNTAVSWRAGETRSVTFSHNMGVGQVANIDVSRDGGATWSFVAAITTTSATSGTFNWLVNGPPTAQARIRVTWAADPAVTDISNVDFKILPRTTVTAPNTAVTWAAGSTRAITWTHNLGAGGTVNIDFSPDNGATWAPITANLPSTTATNGSYTGPMPATVTTQGLIRVCPTIDSTLGDISDAPFTLATPAVTVTAPNTAVTWAVGSTQLIKWNHNLGTADSVKIELARDGINYTETIAPSVLNNASTTGTFNWTVTGPATTTATVRITWTASPAVTDISNVNFKIN